MKIYVPLIEKKVHEIAEVLFEMTKSKRAVSNSGLFGGNIGVLLFFTYYMKQYKKKEYGKIYDSFCNEYFDNLVSIPINNHTYGNGLSGIFACLRFMNEAQLIEIDYSDVEQGYKETIFNCMNIEFHNNHYDVLHGALGDVLYFADDRRFTERAVSWLENNAVRDGDRIKWVSLLDIKSGRMGYNICLSHGMASIIYVLCEIYKNELFTDRVKDLAESAVQYVLSQQLDPGKYGCYFPAQSTDNGDDVYRSRLAWCYGDLGIATSLWHAGKTFDNISWQKLAVEVMQFAASRRNLSENGVVDAGICHGSAGIAMMFRHMYDQTGEKCLMDASDYWIEVSLNMAKFSDGLAGYKTYNHEVEGDYENNTSLLEGITGIGLALLTVSNEKENSNKWMELFMLP